MSQFDNVSIKQSANIYFDGKVTSRSLTFSDGTTKSLGVMLPGDYEFGANEEELMEIVSGKLELLLPGSEWQTIIGGESFGVPANSSFQVKVIEITDSTCHYIK
jgi:uncharacterized protein YaiE (UPF0345 family)